MPGIGQLLRLAFAVGALIGVGGGVLGTLATQSTYGAINKRVRKKTKFQTTETPEEIGVQPEGDE